MSSHPYERTIESNGKACPPLAHNRERSGRPWPEEPEPFNFTRDVVESLAVDKRRALLRFVDDQGVIDRRTFDEVAAAAGQWAAFLRARGLVPGDRVVVLLGPTPFWPAVLLGALKAGPWSTVPRSDLERELELRLGQSGPAPPRGRP